MKRLHLAIIGLLAASTATYAQNQPTPVEPGAHFAARLMEPATTDRVVRNPNECAPDRATPLWGARSVLQGYACYHNENGG
jgi:hypothetical protein